MPLLTRKFCLLASTLIAMTSGGFAQIAEIPAPRLAFVRTVTSEKFLVAGEVTARTELDFTILERTSETTTVVVGENTAFLKGAVSIKLADLMVGDKVSVSVVRRGDGKLQAVNVTVRVGNE